MQADTPGVAVALAAAAAVVPAAAAFAVVGYSALRKSACALRHRRRGFDPAGNWAAPTPLSSSAYLLRLKVLSVWRS